MKDFTYIIASILFLISFNLSSAQETGQNIFTKTCSACHTIGEGKRVGPDLAGVPQKRDEQWLVKFIQSSQSLITSGDSLANAVFEENNKIVMPDQPLTEGEIKSVLDYISSNSPEQNNLSKNSQSPVFNPNSITDVNIERGRNLFEGNIKFKNEGPACIACHNVSMPNVFSGGLLAKDLSDAVSRLSPAGVDGIIRNPPFPAMINSFGNNPLTDDEAKDLLAFLYDADKWHQTKQLAGNSDLILLFAVIIGLNIIFIIFLFKWNQVKKVSVNSFN